MKHRSSRTLLGAVSVVLLGLAAGCGGDDDDSSTASTAPAAAQATQAPSATSAPTAESAAPASAADATTLPASDYPAGPATEASTAPAAAAVVNVAESSLGPILVDGNGMTLYMFVPDAQGPSTCTGGCLTAWPAMAGPATAGDGVTGTLATAARPDDGSEQATINGWPLYRYAEDTAPGDVFGQDANEKWYVLDASGTPVGME